MKVGVEMGDVEVEGTRIAECDRVAIAARLAVERGRSLLIESFGAFEADFKRVGTEGQC